MVRKRGEMKIERIELRLLNLPYVHPFETSLGREEERTFILVRIYADGLCGYGEVVAGLFPLYSYETTSTAWLVLKEYLVPLVFKKTLIRPEDFSAEVRRYRGHPMAKAGLELALWDLAAKAAGKPLWELYGSTKREIPSGVSVGIQDTVEQLIERIRAFLEEGYPRIKIKIKPGWDTAVCEAVRNTFSDIPLQADANGAYSLRDKALLKRLDTFHLQMLEQPFPPYDLWDHSRLQKEMATPLCLDESAVSAEAVRQALDMGSCRVVNIKVGRVGGIEEARRIHDLCEEQNIPVWCGGMLESGIGRAHNIHLATLPNFRLSNDLSASRRYYAEDLIEPAIEITPRGTLRVPDGPGIGVHPVEDRIRRATRHKEVLRP